MKKHLSIVLLFVIVFGTLSTPVSAIDAIPTASTVLVDGKNIAFDAYLIEGNNYFKLRDLAHSLNGTTKQFEVGYDGETNSIALTTGQSYTVLGGEMEGKGIGTKEATPTDSKIIKDGMETQFTAYLIDGNNYFKLRDIGQAFDFSVEWDGESNTIAINTNKGYTPDNDILKIENKVPLNFTDGYELAEFSKFNSPASENGLGGTKIYLDCVINNIRIIDTDAGGVLAGYLTDNNDNKWMSLLHVIPVVNEKEFDGIINKPIVLCGEYSGYSGTEKMPVIDLCELCVKETGEIKSGFRKILSYSESENTKEVNKGELQKATSEYDFTTESGIASYLTEKYPSISTAMGVWKFKYSVYKNTYEFLPHDYSINVEYDLGQMNDLQYSNEYTKAEKEEIKKQLKSFMKNIADDLLGKIKNKKITGSYHYSYYKYRYIEEGLTTLDYCTWSNFDWGGDYSETSVSTFRWLPSFDEEVW